MGGSLQLQEDVSSNPNLSFFCSYNLFIPSPPSGAFLSPSNQGLGKEGEDPVFTPPLIPGKDGRKKRKNLNPPSLARKEAKGDNYN